LLWKFAFEVRRTWSSKLFNPVTLSERPFHRRQSGRGDLALSALSQTRSAVLNEAPTSKPFVLCRGTLLRPEMQLSLVLLFPCCFS